MTEIPDSYRPCPQCGTACAYAHQYCAGCGFPIGSLEIKSEDKLVGQALPGGYLVLELLSVGGMGRVYRAEQRALGRTVAVKVIHPHLLSDENSVMRFMTEARAASQLNHPNTVSVIDFGRTEDGQPYLVMEYLRGKDLARILHDEGQLSFERSAKLVRQVLHALTEAHELGIVHRDLKPDNIFLLKEKLGFPDFVKLIDFGISRSDEATPDMSMTATGTVVGTPYYLSPEQARGTETSDGRADLYSLGVLLYESLSGQLPLQSKSFNDLMFQIVLVEPPHLQERCPELDPTLSNWIMRALTKDRSERWQSAEEMRLSLENWANESGLSFASIPGSSRRTTISTPDSFGRSPAENNRASANYPQDERWRLTPSVFSSTDAKLSPLGSVSQILRRIKNSPQLLAALILATASVVIAAFVLFSTLLQQRHDLALSTVEKSASENISSSTAQPGIEAPASHITTQQKPIEQSGSSLQTVQQNSNLEISSAANQATNSQATPPSSGPASPSTVVQNSLPQSQESASKKFVAPSNGSTQTESSTQPSQASNSQASNSQASSSQAPNSQASNPLPSSSASANSRSKSSDSKSSDSKSAPDAEKRERLLGY